ncbi:glycerol-3-phosphate responsive antiterminator [Christensenellaceae bacterium OttesenSCG-928-K19]|nr:glycerol-3-phosphate responsive antiterminator [Christensenellaceae bacterium OttesenSCG-928-K19]
MATFIEESPIIAAVKDKASLSTACRLSIPSAFLLFGNISDLAQNVQVLKENGKKVFVHVDLIDGLRPDREGIRFIARTVAPYGILSTKTIAIKQAKEHGLKTVFRIFMIDASAFDTGVHAVKTCQPDAVEIMPGLAYDVIDDMGAHISVPIIAGGMIKTKQQMEKAIQSGAKAISTSDAGIWNSLP